MALDPRTKLYLVALANLLLFFHVDVVVESLTVLLASSATARRGTMGGCGTLRLHLCIATSGDLGIDA